MWECWNCGFQNVDAQPVCAKCRARKPAEGEQPKGRSYHFAQQSARERAADEVLSKAFPKPPELEELASDWAQLAKDPARMAQALAKIEHRQYITREAIRLLMSIVKNPQVKGKDELMQNIYTMLLNWEEK
jgi:thioredoxin-like negative regulator of GroEL